MINVYNFGAKVRLFLKTRKYLTWEKTWDITILITLTLRPV